MAMQRHRQAVGGAEAGKGGGPFAGRAVFEVVGRELRQRLQPLACGAGEEGVVTGAELGADEKPRGHGEEGHVDKKPRDDLQREREAHAAHGISRHRDR